ncbi:MAG: acetylornithine deacetylase, partial [Rhizobacter sp.]|nr:acetylornithine deacetylase [Rhizobacter sp.]
APAIELLRRLVAFDTVSRHSNLALIDWVRDYLDGHGVASTLIFDTTGTKANLFATIGPADREGYVLSGHTDVVPIDGQAWTSDPFTLTERGSKLYGRGASDMKAYIAVALAEVPRLLQRRLARPVHLCFSYDEEVGCKGAPSLIEHMRHLEAPPLVCIVGEPTEMEVVIAHKGNVRYRCTVNGHECHSALIDQGANAVEAAAELVAKLKSMARRKRDLGPFDAAFDPPYTTVHTGIISGGTAVNIVPKECHFEFEIRYIPGEDPEALMNELKAYSLDVIEPEMRRVSAETGVEFLFKSALTGLDTSPTAEAARITQLLAARQGTKKISFGTEGGLFGRASIPTVVCGPGSIEQAHKPDEWIEASQIAACEAFMARLADQACST